MRLDIALETTPKKAFATAIDWSGLARSGKTTDLALDALRAALPRCPRILGRRDPPLGTSIGPARSFRLDETTLRAIENETGSAGDHLGVSSRITTADRRPIDAPCS